MIRKFRFENLSKIELSFTILWEWNIHFMWAITFCMSVKPIIRVPWVSVLKLDVSYFDAHCIDLSPYLVELATFTQLTFAVM